MMTTTASIQPSEQGHGDIPRLLSAIANNPGQSTEAASAINLIADASKDTTTRNVLGQRESLSNVLAFLENLLGQAHVGTSMETVAACLRCVGNSCIDNDEARKHVIDHESSLSWARQCLDRSSDLQIRLLAAKVLYNICMDNENCQKACYENRLYIPVQQLIMDGLNHESDRDLPLLLELLFWIVSQKPADSAQTNITEVDISGFLYMPPVLQTHVSTEDFASAVETCLCLLRDTEVQQIAVNAKLFSAIWVLLMEIELRTQARSNPDSSGTGKQVDQIDRAEEDNNSEEDVKLLVPLSTSLTWVISDISALPDFTPTSSDLAGLANVIQRLEDFHTSGKKPSYERIASAACQVYGNYLFSQPLSTDCTIENLHRALFHGIVQTENAELMYSAAGLIVHLSRPSVDAREAIASDANAKSAMEKLCRHGMPQLKQAGIKLLRALGKESKVNQTLFATLGQEVMIDLQSSADVDGTSDAPQIANGVC
ncbi:hypothetical protein K431DRAFT_116444 [Polychaeton citri CBS 116435]|uniref:Uncharacterized protein n=1 Tax=Polychaeton citri CBS 116435 TaxID=1314669 RepID=A0A9P4USG0_9PEZI|nr:hypothetical protein K431DRAFT_116444 [Polychaeton citri CBS 116435]